MVLLSLALFAMPVPAATTQQEKTQACNASAKGLKDGEYRKIRIECLKARKSGGRRRPPARNDDDGDGRMNGAGLAGLRTICGNEIPALAGFSFIQR